MTIRDETSDDRDVIHQVEAAAFGRAMEADLVDRLRDNGAVTLSLVAEVEARIAGHILFSPATVESGSTHFPAVALGPLAVLPSQQNRGIGGALCREGLKRCQMMGHDLVFLVGHPDYYPRFGFQLAAPLGFGCDFATPGEPNEHFMVIALRDGALDGKSGYLRYRPEFDRV